MKAGHAIRRAAAPAVLFMLAVPVTQAFAHAADRGFVMLLPTGYYMWSGAAAVAASFLVLALVPPRPLDRLAGRRLRLASIGVDGRFATSLISFLAFAGLLAAGMWGSRDPLSNPLPLIIWTVWWVGLTLLCGLLGNLWRWLDPWYAPWRVAAAILRIAPERPPLSLPVSAEYWLAIAFFAGFAWFELVYPAPDDPERLAIAAGVYWCISFAGSLLFGHSVWTSRAECFSVFFAMIARLSPFERAGSRLSLLLPGAKLADAEPLPVSGALFLLLALSTVSFDGLMRTFFWLGRIGVNPLEFPGRSAVMGSSTAGLVLAFALLAAAFFTAIWLGGRLAGDAPPGAAGRLVWSIIPISLAYHFSHYLVSLAVDGQYALAAISDPFVLGWNLFGTAGYHVSAAVAVGYDSAWIIWNLQAAAIVGGHVLAVAVAHLIAWRLYGDVRRAALSQLPLALLMVAYTVLGLWLLSSPTA